MVVLVEVVLVVLVVLVVGESAAGGGVGRWLPGCDVSFDSRGAPLFPRRRYLLYLDRVKRAEGERWATRRRAGGGVSRCCEVVDRNRKAERELYLYVRRMKEESGVVG